MKNTMSRMLLNHTAAAQDTCAASACPNMRSILVIIMDANLLLGSIFVLLVDLIISNNRMTAHSSPLCGAAQAA